MINLSTFTADFEHALLNAARKTFPDAVLIGCLFHWKQALHRKMLDLRIPKEVVAIRLWHRLATGIVGRAEDGSNLYGKQLLEVLGTIG